MNLLPNIFRLVNKAKQIGQYKLANLLFGSLIASQEVSFEIETDYGDPYYDLLVSISPDQRDRVNIPVPLVSWEGLSLVMRGRFLGTVPRGEHSREVLATGEEEEKDLMEEVISFVNLLDVRENASLIRGGEQLFQSVFGSMEIMDTRSPRIPPQGDGSPIPLPLRGLYGAYVLHKKETGKWYLQFPVDTRLCVEFSSQELDI